MQTIEKIYDTACNVVMFLCKLFLIADVLITSYAVLGRYVSFIDDPVWSEEIVLTCMIYMTFLSAAIGVHKQAHIRMTSLDSKLPSKLVQVLDIFADILVVIFAIIMIIYGFNYCNSFMNVYYTSIPTLPRFWKYLPIPVAGIAILLFQIEVLVKHIRIIAGRAEVKEVAAS